MAAVFHAAGVAVRFCSHHTRVLVLGVHVHGLSSCAYSVGRSAFQWPSVLSLQPFIHHLSSVIRVPLPVEL